MREYRREWKILLLTIAKNTLFSNVSHNCQIENQAKRVPLCIINYSEENVKPASSVMCAC